MLIDFSFSNFSSIKDKQTLSMIADSSTKLKDYYIVEPYPNLYLLKIACIYGANASGKTNILDAFTFLRFITNSLRENKDKTLPFEPFLFVTKDSQEPTEFEVRFVHQNIVFQYHILFNKKAILQETLLADNELIFERKTNEKTAFVEILFPKQLKVPQFIQEFFQSITIWNNSVLAVAKTINHNIIPLKTASEWFYYYFYPLASHKYKAKSKIIDFVTNNLYNEKISKKAILNLLQKADLNIIEFELEKKIDDSGFNLTFSHKIGSEKYELPFHKQSKGTQFYYTLAGILELMMQKPMFISFDELANSIHPDLLEHFLLLFLKNTQNSQLIFTTHHRELLLEQDILRKDVIWFTEKNNKGATELFSLTDFDEITDNSSWYYAYKTGKIGAKPSLKDTYLEKL
jgi:AAA15 family ATPase/GTPase